MTTWTDLATLYDRMLEQDQTLVSHAKAIPPNQLTAEIMAELSRIVDKYENGFSAQTQAGDPEVQTLILELGAIEHPPELYRCADRQGAQGVGVFWEDDDAAAARMEAVAAELPGLAERDGTWWHFSVMSQRLAEFLAAWDFVITDPDLSQEVKAFAAPLDDEHWDVELGPIGQMLVDGEPTSLTAAAVALLEEASYRVHPDVFEALKIGPAAVRHRVALRDLSACDDPQLIPEVLCLEALGALSPEALRALDRWHGARSE